MMGYGKHMNCFTVKENHRMKSLACHILSACLGLLLITAGTVLAEAPRTLDPGEGAEAYLQKLEKMPTAECGQCHVEIYNTIRDKGGLHQLECTDCHTKFHTFTPGIAWADRVPACSDCHEGVHDGKFPACLTCHGNAHAPIAFLVSAEKMTADCAGCHTPVAEAIKAHPSKHAEVGCVDCHHDQHGYKPGCNECHPQPHMPYQNNEGCVKCHQPHTPLQIVFSDTVENSVCQSCHPEPVAIMAASKKKHGPLQCVLCHSKEHGTIPTCQQCHADGPHNPELLKGFSGCLDCHGDPHGLTLTGGK